MGSGREEARESDEGHCQRQPLPQIAKKAPHAFTDAHVTRLDHLIHFFRPSRVSPFFTACVLAAATSEPAPGSVTQYAAFNGASVRRPRYFFLSSSFAPTRTGAIARPETRWWTDTEPEETERTCKCEIQD